MSEIIDYGAEGGLDSSLESFPLEVKEKPQLVTIDDIVATTVKTKDGTEINAIEYTIRSYKNVERANSFRDLEPKSAAQFEIYKKRFANIYEAVMGEAPPKDLLKGCKDFKEVTERFASVFVTGKNKPKKFRKSEDEGIPYWFIPVYDDRGYVSMPVVKFMEPVLKDKEGKVIPPRIEVTSRMNVVAPKKSSAPTVPSGVPNVPGMSDLPDDDLPD